jgi:hypothetical protein
VLRIEIDNLIYSRLTVGKRRKYEKKFSSFNNIGWGGVFVWLCNDWAEAECLPGWDNGLGSIDRPTDWP